MYTSQVHMSVYLQLCFCVSPGSRAYRNAHFGAGSGPIFLDDVRCISSASKLLECYSKPILSHNCLHAADAGVRCEGVLPIKYFLSSSLSNTTRALFLQYSTNGHDNTAKFLLMKTKALHKMH